MIRSVSAAPRLLPALPLLLAAACSSDSAMHTELNDGGYLDTGAVPLQLRLDVHPSDATPDLEPQSVVLDVSGDWTGLDVEIRPSVTLSGLVQGFLVTPYAGEPTVPGEDDQPIAALVAAVIDGSIAGGNTSTAEDGSFSLTIPPGYDYRLEILPVDTDLVPFATRSIPVLASDLDLGLVYLDYGAPVWGRVTHSDGAIPDGATVHLVDITTGARGPATTVDGEGWYLLRAYGGDYTVVVEGRDGGVVPTVKQPVTVDDVTGARVDLDVGTSERVDVGGYLLDSGGQGLVSEGTNWLYTVRCTALDLRDVEGELVVEDTTRTGGRFDLQLAPGTWKVELIPPYESTLSPQTQILDVGETDLDLGDLVLADRVMTELIVRDPAGRPEAGVLVVAQELTYDGYTFDGLTDADGRLVMEVPRTLLELTLSPAAADAAITRLTVDSDERSVFDLHLDAGVPVDGAVTSDGEPVPYALVEVRDAGGRLYATALTDDQGRFAMRVDDEPSDVQD